MIILPEVMLGRSLPGVFSVLAVSRMQGLWIKGVIDQLVKAPVEFQQKRRWRVGGEPRPGIMWIVLP